MSGWKTLEAHSLNGEFSETRISNIKEKIEAECKKIKYCSSKRIVGISGYKDNFDTVADISSYEDTGVAVAQANDTSDVGSVRFIINGQTVREFPKENRCNEASKELQEKYGIYLYVSEYWERINCCVDGEMMTGDSDGHIQVSNYPDGKYLIYFKQYADESSTARVNLDNTQSTRLANSIEEILDDRF